MVIYTIRTWIYMYVVVILLTLLSQRNEVPKSLWIEGRDWYVKAWPQAGM